MKLSEARYILEHRLFPEWFFKDKLQFVGAITDKDQTAMYDIMKKICEQENVKCTYKSEQYKSEVFKLDKDKLLVKLTFPEPENTPLCYRAYMIFNESFTEASYFTIEKSFDNKAVLCAWDKKKTHLNYGMFDGGKKQEMLRVIEIHTSNFSKNNK